MNKFLSTLSYAVLLGACSMMVYLFYVWFYPFQVIKQHYSIIPIVTKEVKAGEYLTYKIDVEHLTEGIAVDVSGQLIGDTIVDLPNKRYITEKKRVTSTSTVYIPEGTPKGKYHAHFTSAFHLFALRDIITSSMTEEFTVL